MRLSRLSHQSGGPMFKYGFTVSIALQPKEN